MEGPARYRRAFDWALNIEDKDDTTIALRALVGLSGSEMPEVLEDYLIVSRKRRQNRLAIAKLQVHLVDELLTIEATTKHYRNKKAELQHHDSGDREGLGKETEEDLKFVRSEIFLWRAYANVLRSVADGIAWRALGYDRAVMRALCQNRGSQQITSSGTTEELREWSRQFDERQGLAILNSLTNCLTYGDVTLVRNDGSVEVIEVKRSKTTSSRVIRQKQRMREMVTLLRTGRGSLEGKTVEVCSLDITPENGLGILHGLLQQASSPPGYAASRISNSTYIECVDFRVMEKDGNKQLVEKRNSLIAEWVARGDEIHSSESLRCLSFSPNLAPFSIFPFEPKICVDLLIGAKSYRVLLNLTAVVREFEYRGWQVTTTPLEAFKSGKLPEDFMTVKKDGFFITVPPAAFMRLQMELLRPQVLIQQCELLKRGGPAVVRSEFNLTIYDTSRKRGIDPPGRSAIAPFLGTTSLLVPPSWLR